MNENKNKTPEVIISSSAKESLALMWVKKNAEDDTTPARLLELYYKALTEIETKSKEFKKGWQI